MTGGRPCDIRNLTLGVNQIGLTVGLTDGNFKRSELEADTTHNYALYVRYANEEYQSQSAGVWDKRWEYDGNGVYGEFYWWQDLKESTFRFSLYGERRHADLIEIEDKWNRTSGYSERYDPGLGVHFRVTHNSNFTLKRSGTGTFDYHHYRVAIGGDWQMLSEVRILGGLVFDDYQRDIIAREPLEYHQWFVNESTKDSLRSEKWRADVRTHTWQKHDRLRFLAIPVGVIFAAGKSIDLQIGLSKQYIQIDIDRGYDVLITLDRDGWIENGERMEFVDSLTLISHEYSPVHELEKDYTINTTIVFKRKEHIRFTMAFSGGIIEPRNYKIGLEFRW